MAQKPSIPKGTRDFGPEEMIKRTYIFDTIKSVFRTCGFQPLETPAMENLSTLLGKYGDEGDKLLFKILNSGDFLSGIPSEETGQGNSNALSTKICEKGLRYDLTVPFARYVVQHQNEISFPFKRYQIQPVWRADRPQKGRYREFYQCDVDVIGSRSLINEVELIEIVEKVFAKLGIAVTLKMNNRKNSLRDRRDDRPCRQDDGYHHSNRQTRKDRDRSGQCAAAREWYLGSGRAGAAANPVAERQQPRQAETAARGDRRERDRTQRNRRDGNDLRLHRSARHFAGNRARPVAGTGIELLYRGDLRGEIERFRDRKYLRRRTVRRPNGHLRHAEHVRCRYFVRERTAFTT